MSPASEAARALVASARVGALATAADGAVASTLIAIADDGTGSPISVLSGLSEHTRLLRRSPTASVLIFEDGHGPGGALDRRRVTLSGAFRFLDAEERPFALERFLALHPEASSYAHLTDFAPARLDVERVRWVGGFALAASLRAEEYLGLGALPSMEALATIPVDTTAQGSPHPLDDWWSWVRSTFSPADRDFVRLQLAREGAFSKATHVLAVSRDRRQAVVHVDGGLAVLPLPGGE